VTVNPDKSPQNFIHPGVVLGKPKDRFSVWEIGFQQLFPLGPVHREDGPPDPFEFWPTKKSSRIGEKMSIRTTSSSSIVAP
jgi:hypothetical protein